MRATTIFLFSDGIIAFGFYDSYMRNKKLIVLFSILAFLTLLVVLSSVIFSVQNVYASCYNDENDAYDSLIASKDINGIAKGKSIFLLNEKKAIESIESNCSDVKVVNIERKFPNQVYINYVKIFPYIALETEDCVLYASNNGKILSKGDKQETYSDYIKLIASVTPASETVGDLLYVENTAENTLISGILNTIERLDLRNVMVDMFEFIDVSYVDRDGIVPRVYMKTRTGTYFELQGGATNIDKKIRFAVSVYLSDETTYMHGGTIVVNTSGNGASFTRDNRYENTRK